MKKFLFYTAYYIFIFGLFFSLAEFLVRLRGYRPWQPPEGNILVEPGGKFFEKNPTLGYTHVPGDFKVTIPGPYSFHVTHRDNTLRITHPLDTYSAARAKPEIWIFGCSFTHGWTLNNEETFAWLLQKKLPDYEVVNFGVNGYSNVHSLIQLREALERREKPKVVILAHASFHDERNTFLRARRKAVAPANKLGQLAMPCARMGRDGKIHYLMADVEYREFPLMRHSAFMHFIEQEYNKLEDRKNRSHEVSKAIIKDLHALCKSNNIELIIAGLGADPATQDTLNFCKREGIRAVDISVDLTIKENTNLPYDAHPSARSNVQYANKLEAFLTHNVLTDYKTSARY